MALYREHFGVLVLTYMIALIPAHLFVRPFVSGITGMTGYFVLILLTGFIAYAALAVAVSDICIGNKPSVVRCYKYVFTKNVFRLFLTILLTMLVLLSGYILLIIPGIVFSAWYMFSAVVVVLEKVGPSAAMKRSRFLGRGFYARNYCLFALTSFVLGVIAFLVGLTSGTAIIVLKLRNAEGLILGVTTLLASVVLNPYVYVLLILMYYDLRARREGYDSTALTEDLQR